MLNPPTDIENFPRVLKLNSIFKCNIKWKTLTPFKKKKESRIEKKIEIIKRIVYLKTLYYLNTLVHTYIEYTLCKITFCLFIILYTHRNVMLCYSY